MNISIVCGRFPSVLMVVLFLLGCSTQPLSSFVIPNKVHVKSDAIFIQLPEGSKASGSIPNLQFLGVGGFAFEVDGHKVITAPSYTNPRFLNNFRGVPVAANHERIDSQFPEILWDSNNEPGERVKGIIVGHSHYDHLLVM